MQAQVLESKEGITDTLPQTTFPGPHPPQTFPYDYDQHKVNPLHFVNY